MDDPAPDGTYYADFRTGLTFAEVRQMMWVGSADPRGWKNKRRHGVLGFWRELKLQMWDTYCQQQTTKKG